MEVIIVIALASFGWFIYFLQKKLKEKYSNGAPDFTNTSDSLDTISTLTKNKKSPNPYERVENDFLGACARAKQVVTNPKKIDEIVAKYKKRTERLKEKLQPLKDQLKVLEAEMSDVDISERKFESLEKKEEKLEDKISEIEEKIEEIEEELSETNIGISVIRPDLSMGLPLDILENYGKYIHEIPTETQNLYKKYLDHYLSDVEILDFDSIYHADKDLKLQNIKGSVEIFENGNIKEEVKCSLLWERLENQKCHRARKKYEDKNNIIKMIEADKLASLFDLSNNIMTILEDNSIDSVDLLQKYDLEKLEQIKGIGKHTIENIKLGLDFISARKKKNV